MSEMKKLLEIHMDGSFRCLDKTCGHVSGLVFNPHTTVATYVILHKDALLQQEFLVPLDLVIGMSHNALLLNCKSWEVTNLQPFHHTRFIPLDPRDYPHIPGAVEDTSYEWPVSKTEDGYALAMDMEAVPRQQQVLRGETVVQAKDGTIGHVKEFVLQPGTYHMTYLVLRQGHLWGRRDVAIPISAVDHFEHGAVFLALDKRAIGQLPRIPVQRGP